MWVHCCDNGRAAPRRAPFCHCAVIEGGRRRSLPAPSDLERPSGHVFRPCPDGARRISTGGVSLRNARLNTKDNAMKALGLVVAWAAVAGIVLITRASYRSRRATR